MWQLEKPLKRPEELLLPGRLLKQSQWLHHLRLLLGRMALKAVNL
jgi:hypothetical protein